MAWTTSACLRARPIRSTFPAAPFKAARFLAAAVRRALAAGTLLILHAIRTTPQSAPARVAGTHGAARRGALRPPSRIARERHWRAAAPQARRMRPAEELRERSWADLMARINHDLRTPLNAVIGFSELMVLELYGPLGDERYQDYVQHIRDSGTELLKSAEDTLALTALMTGPSRRDPQCACDLEQLAVDAWTFLSRKAAARAVSVDASIPVGLEVLAEPRALRQVLVNMLSEGIARATHGERVILVAVSEGDLVELALSVSGERAHARCKDGSLAICLARTLLEMQGASLLEFDGVSTGWRAVTVLDRAVQPDFFSKTAGAAQDYQHRGQERMAPVFAG